MYPVQRFAGLLLGLGGIGIKIREPRDAHGWLRLLRNRAT